MRYPVTLVYGHPMDRTPEELEREAGTDDETLVLTYTAEIENVEDQAQRFRLIRDDIIRRLVAKHGPAQTARITGLSLSTIKNVRGRPQPRSTDWPLDVAD